MPAWATKEWVDAWLRKKLNSNGGAGEIILDGGDAPNTFSPDLIIDGGDAT